jgi:hypothetical protein
MEVLLIRGVLGVGPAVRAPRQIETYLVVVRHRYCTFGQKRPADANSPQHAAKDR